MTLIYTFKNAETLTINITKDEKSYDMYFIWSFYFTQEAIKPILDEYLNIAIPFLFQKVANFLGYPCVWFDKSVSDTAQRFDPQNQQIFN